MIKKNDDCDIKRTTACRCEECDNHLDGCDDSSSQSQSQGYGYYGEEYMVHNPDNNGGNGENLQRSESDLVVQSPPNRKSDCDIQKIPNEIKIHLNNLLTNDKMKKVLPNGEILEENLDWTCTTRRQLLSSFCVSSILLGGMSANAEEKMHSESDKLCVDIENSVESVLTNNNSPNDNNVRNDDLEYLHEFTNYKSIIPFSSVREQKMIILSNGLKVLLVNDIQTSQSTAALIIHGPGQFQDPKDLPGAAHLMEHMVMSYNLQKAEKQGKNTRKRSKYIDLDAEEDGDIEEWIGEYGGSSNAYTAYDRTCFHLNCPHDILPEALDKFSSLFVKDNVVRTCMDEEILKREIQRVDDELDLESLAAKQEYITKSYVENRIDKVIDQPQSQPHPYSKFSRGSYESLEKIPKLENINVSKKLVQFFEDYYVATQAVLVVVGNVSSPTSSSSSHQQSNLAPLSTMERWVAMFDKTFSSDPPAPTSETKKYHYPAQFRHPIPYQYNHLLLRQKGYEGAEKMTLRWILNEDYYISNDEKTTAFEIAFVLNQILCRRDDGSLYQYLRKKDWIQNRSTIPPLVTVPINVSGFQMLKMELTLTPEGFKNREKVVAALHESIETMRNTRAKDIVDSFQISKEIIAQHATTAKLFGYLLTPRPPDAVELALDSIDYGFDSVKSMAWYRFADLGEGSNKDSFKSLNRVKRAVNSALQIMSDPKNALIIVVAGDNSSNIMDVSQSLSKPLLFPRILDAKNMGDSNLLSENIYSSAVPVISSDYRNQLRPPSCNPLIPISLSQPRRIKNKFNKSLITKKLGKYPNSGSWVMLLPNKNTPTLLLPRSPPEPSCRCAFVLQLLSPKPMKASAEQAAYGELWRLSFEDAAAKRLAEQGASGALAYELRFNQFGMRISFMGLSQSISGYTKQVINLLVKNHNALLNGNRELCNRSIAIAEIKKIRALPTYRKTAIVDALENASAQDVAMEGSEFLASCSSAVCFSQGDITPRETQNLLLEVQDLLKGYTENRKGDESPNFPSIKDLLDTPVWKPRNGSPCYQAGVSLMSDACGRVLR